MYTTACGVRRFVQGTKYRSMEVHVGRNAAHRMQRRLSHKDQSERLIAHFSSSSPTRASKLVLLELLGAAGGETCPGTSSGSEIRSAGCISDTRI